MGIVLTEGKRSTLINRHLIFVLSLLSMDKEGIANVLRSNEERRATYFDRDSEDDGTARVEVAFLRLCQDIFLPAPDVAADLQVILDEMNWIICLSLHQQNFGQVNLDLLHGESYDLIWDVLRRYASLIFLSFGVEKLDVSREGFFEALTFYSYTYTMS